jgi:hypothetical protein
MKWKMLSSCAAIMSLLFTSIVFAEKEESFVHKIVDGGSISQSIRTADGNFAYLNGLKIVLVNNESEKRISGISLSFEIPSWGYVWLRGIDQIADGFVLVGGSQPDGYYGNSSALVVKVNSQGEVEWNKTFSIGSNSSFDSVIATPDGGFIAIGSTDFQGWHPILLKFSSDGNVLLSKSFDNLSGSFQAKPDVDGGVVLAADLIGSDWGSYGVNVVKINEAGNIVWAKSLVQVEGFSLHSMTTLGNQGYLFAGSGTDPKTLLLIRLNADGSFHSKAAYSLAPRFAVMSLAQTPDGGAAVGGVLIRNSGAQYDGFLLKLNDRQKLVFHKRLGFKNNLEGIASVIAKEDGSYLVFGSSGLGQHADTLLVSINKDGLVPGCGFSHDLKVLKARFGELQRQNFSITTSNLPLPTPGSIKITSRRLHREITDGCAN